MHLPVTRRIGRFLSCAITSILFIHMFLCGLVAIRVASPQSFRYLLSRFLSLAVVHSPWPRGAVVSLGRRSE